MPFDSTYSLPKPLAKKLTRQLRLVGVSLLWEAFWPLAWPVPALIALFFALALMDILPRLNPWLHAAILLAFAVSVAAALSRLRKLRMPSIAQMERRLEQRNALTHQPLALLADRQVTGEGDSLATALWQTARERTRQRLHHLTIPLPRPNLAFHDPLGLRFLPFLLLAIGIAAGWPTASVRLSRALNPVGLAGPPAELEVWVTPPDYTGLPPLQLTGAGNDKLVVIPAGSKITAALQGGAGRAKLLVDGKPTKFQRLDQKSQHLEATLTLGSSLTIRQGFHQLARWNIRVLADLPPEITFTGPVAIDPLMRLNLGVEAMDDYGLAKIWLNIQLVDSPEGTPLIVPLPLPGKTKEIHHNFVIDLSSHPWAGLPVTMVPFAEDGAGQLGHGKRISVTLPERVFTHPVARAVVGLRRVLIRDSGQRDLVTEGLQSIIEAPEKFGGDFTTDLVLIDAMERLSQDHADDAVAVAIDLMWQAALRIEEGDRASARDAFDAAAKNLADALAKGASPGEIESLMNRLKEAMARYAGALAKDGQKTPLPPGTHVRVISDKELQAMLNQLNDLSRTGSKEAAQAMLERLKKLMDSLTFGVSGNFVEGQPGTEAGLDPLGRPIGDKGSGADENIKIPDENEIGKAREILDELRRRTDDYQRPAEERNYLNRLLEKLY